MTKCLMVFVLMLAALSPGFADEATKAKRIEELLALTQADKLVEKVFGSDKYASVVTSILSEMGIPFTGSPSAALDLSSDKVLAKLVRDTDVLVQNFRPGTMERLGLGAEELRQRHPRLIYVSISGVGDTGPYVKKRVYDPIIQGLSGFADIQSQPVTNRPQMIRTIVCDKTTAVFTAQAVCAAINGIQAINAHSHHGYWRLTMSTGKKYTWLQSSPGISAIICMHWLPPGANVKPLISRCSCLY